MNKLFVASICAISVVVSGCATQAGYQKQGYVGVHLGVDDNEAGQETETKRLVRTALTQIEKGQLSQATDALNSALRLDYTNSQIQLLNGINYHLRAVSGESTSYEMAKQAYTAALAFDYSNWNASFYLGLAHLENREYEEAQQRLSEYVLQNDQDVEGLYYLASASYLAGDPANAVVFSARAKQLFTEMDHSDIAIGAKHMNQLLAISEAAMGNESAATAAFDEYVAVEGEGGRSHRLKSRLRNWMLSHKKEESDGEGEEAAESQETTEDEEGSLVLNEQDEDYSSGEDDSAASEVSEEGDETSSEETLGAEYEGDEEDSLASTSEEDEDYSYDDGSVEDENSDESGDIVSAENKMVAVDVIIVRTNDETTDTRGINLLNGLQLQFGDKANGLSAFSKTASRTTDFVTSSNDTATNSITRVITVPALTYSLNIANSQNGVNRIIAKPTLVSRVGQTSEFFAGMEVAAAAVSGGEGDAISVEKEIGVRLAITPEIADDGTVLLAVNAERTFLTAPSSSIVFQYRMDTTKTQVNANVALQFGQTLILSGLTESDMESNNDGVPLLRDIPVVDMLFSQKSERQTANTVMILLTPRYASYMGKGQVEQVTSASGNIDAATFELIFSDWYQPQSAPAMDLLVDRFSKKEFYRSFQTADVPDTQWYDSRAHAKRLDVTISSIFDR